MVGAGESLKDLKSGAPGRGRDSHRPAGPAAGQHRRAGGRAGNSFVEAGSPLKPGGLPRGVGLGGGRQQSPKNWNSQREKERDNF